ncbi:hypothetical protein [Campylobacter sp.]|uniref:hypothetical protein n=2 Tax=Campylobacter sp. TaxID=205 RepID=UPI002AA5FA9A|nr:hypothetical protein [Campylobacter sp.]MCI7075823.1 hypothetical protein [Campylobacter sp.]
MRSSCGFFIEYSKVKLNANAKNIKQYLKDIFKNENLHSIFLSEETLAQHFLKHPEITANEYTKIPDIIKQKLHIYNSKQDKNRKIIMANYGDKNYKLVLKNIGKKDENFAISLTWLSSNFKELKKEIKRLKNKQGR